MKHHTKQLTWTACAIVCLIFAVPLPAPAAKLMAVYPRGESSNDERSNYSTELLDLTLRSANVDYELRPSNAVMQQGRALSQLAVGNDVTVVVVVTSKERESNLLPIRIPLDKGLGGWRILLINKKMKRVFSEVETVDQLKHFIAGQGHDWPDTEILKANGLRVYGSDTYEGLFKMLQAGRIAYFPRSLHEIWDEEKNHRDMDIAVEDTIILRYPAALYYFVNKDNKALAAAIEKGLRILIKDGSFDKIFYKYYGDPITRSNLKKRKLLTLGNPLLPDATPLQQKELWFDSNNAR
jgi:hypothetical protein